MPQLLRVDELRPIWACRIAELTRQFAAQRRMLIGPFDANAIAVHHSSRRRRVPTRRRRKGAPKIEPVGEKALQYGLSADGDDRHWLLNPKRELLVQAPSPCAGLPWKIGPRAIECDGPEFRSLAAKKESRSRVDVKGRTVDRAHTLQTSDLHGSEENTNPGLTEFL